MGYKIWGCYNWVVSEEKVRELCPVLLDDFYAALEAGDQTTYAFAEMLRQEEIPEPPLEAYRYKTAWNRHWECVAPSMALSAYTQLLWAFYRRTKVPIWICAVDPDWDGAYFENVHYWSVTDTSTVTKLTTAGKALGDALTIETWVEGG